MNGGGDDFRGCRGWLHCRIGGFELRLDWAVAPGRALVLFGPSGAGKTTALRAMAGLLRPAAGRVEIDGRAVYDSAANVWLPAHRRRVGYLTQQYHLFPHLNVAQNVGYGPAADGDDPRRRIAELLDSFELSGLERRYPWELSGGQQQRVALARALATRPRLLLLDEPFAALDVGLRRTVRQELRQYISRAGAGYSPAPVILVTHDREEALSLGDEAQVIDGGQAIARGAPVDVLGQPGQAAVARLVGGGKPVPYAGGFAPSQGRHDAGCRAGGRTAGSGWRRLWTAGKAAPRGRNGSRWGFAHRILSWRWRSRRGSSARNRIAGTVAGVAPRPPGYMVDLDCGVMLRCQVTGASLEEMGIRPGQPLWAVFKASSCFLVRGDGENPV